MPGLTKVRAKLLFAILIATSGNLFLAPNSISISQIAGTGRVTERLFLSVSGMGGRGLMVTDSSTTGAVAVPSGQTAGLIDFGQLTRGTGQPLGAVIGLQVRGNASYRLNVSVSSFQTTTLAIKNVEVSANSNGGSFIGVKLGPVTGTGALSNPAGTAVNGMIINELPLNRISRGPVGPASTTLAEGTAPSLGGNANSPDNAVEIPIIVTVPTGLAISPSRGNAEGYFQVVLQTGIFGQR